MIKLVDQKHSKGPYDQASRPENPEVKPEQEVDADEIGPYISSRQVVKAIKMKDKKATDDDVSGEVLKLLGEDGIKLLTNI